MTKRMFSGLRILGLVATSLAVAGGGSSCGGDKQPQWKLVWADEFDGPAGQAPDANHWRFDVGGDWGNAQLEYDTDRATNVSLDGVGHLAITARQEPYLERAYTSGRINTRGLFEQARGRFEAQIQLPVGQGIWPAFWLLGSNRAEVGWPACGEIDIMESRGQEPNVLLGSLHGPGYSGGNAVSSRYTLSGEGFNAGFHVFAIEWNESSISYLLDGVAYQIISPRNLPAGGRWVFDHPFNIILNVAVGGNFVGPPDATTLFPQVMLVDWVHVYQVK